MALFVTEVVFECGWMEEMKVQDTLQSTHTCMNPSGQPGSSAPEVDNIRLASVVSKSLSDKPSSNRPTVNPSKMI